MNDFRLTDARADVLRAVAAGEVRHYRSWGHDPDEEEWLARTEQGSQR